MKADDSPSGPRATGASEVEPWLQYSDWACDASDRACGAVLLVSVAVASVLAGAWIWAVPSFH